MRRFLALAALGSVAYAAIVRPWFVRWGATTDEIVAGLPGDDLVPKAAYETTRAIGIDAVPGDVWPWLVQLGQGRGGFYTYDRLERFAGAAIENADAIVPELQHLAVGDVVRLSPLGGPAVVQLEPERAIVLHDVMDVRTGRSLPIGTRAPFTMHWTWAFVLRPDGDDATRLIVRTRASFVPRVLEPLVLRMLDPLHFVMERGMLIGMKRRVERRAPANRATDRALITR